MKHQPLNPQLLRHLDHCRRYCDDLKRQGKWLWPDSRDLDDVVESASNLPHA